MLNIRLRWLRSVVCYDGLPHVEMVPQMRTSAGDCTAFYAIKLRKGETLETYAERLREEHPTVIGTVEILPTVTVRRHEHIGEYGSPRNFECRALDNY